MAEKFQFQKQGIKELDEALYEAEFSRADKVSWPAGGPVVIFTCGICEASSVSFQVSRKRESLTMAPCCF